MTAAIEKAVELRRFIVVVRVVSEGREFAKNIRGIFSSIKMLFVLPLSSCAMLLFSSFVTCTDARLALFLVAAAALVLLFVGIHNAWDAVTYHVFTQQNHRGE